MPDAWEQAEQKNRLMVGLGLFGLYVIAIFWDGWLFHVLTFLLALIGTKEVMRTMLSTRVRQPLLLIVGCLGWWILIGAFWYLRSTSPEATLRAVFGGGGYDTFAYLIGKRWGKRKIFPSISPDKTIVGTVGGSLASFLLASVYWFVVYPMESLSLILGPAIVVAILAPVGDFGCSWIKRCLCVKDWGHSLGSHGGVPDRACAITTVSLFLAPLHYLTGSR